MSWWWRRRSCRRPRAARVDLATVVPSAEAEKLAAEVGKDPRLVQVILGESTRVVRSRPNLIIVQHRLGFVMANAGVDQSNVAPADGVHRVLLLPRDPDGSADAIRDRLEEHYGVLGSGSSSATVSVAPGAGAPVASRSARRDLPSLIDLRGQPDLFGRTLEVSIIGYRRRDCRGSFVAAGPGGGSAADRAGTWPRLVGAHCAGR